MNTFDELIERQLVKQCTSFDCVSKLINNGTTFYIGFDPTADSLHVGHLLQLITAKRLASKGNVPLCLIGDATARIGDPSGRSTARPLLNHAALTKNVAGILAQIKKIVPEAKILCNSAWSKDSFLDFISDTGSLFSVSSMLKAECFASRLNSGLTFLEFSYMLLQANDFAFLHKNHNCMIEIGGDDQWSNILAGKDLVKKKFNTEVFGLTIPLLTDSSGVKIGKTVKGAVFLDNSKTSIFDFFQFWRNIPDVDAKRICLMLTDFSKQDIEAMDINECKIKLANHLTEIVHGEDEAKVIANQAKEIFSNKDVAEYVLNVDRSNLIDLIVNINLASSKNQARTLIAQGAIKINNQKATLDTSLEDMSSFLLCKSKKQFIKIVFNN